MRSFVAAAAIAAFTPFVNAAVDISTIRRVSSNNMVPGKYIVELTSAKDLPGSSGAKRAYSPHAELYKALRKRGSSFDVDEEFDEDNLLIGASVTLHDDADLAVLADISGVTAIHPVTLHERPAPVEVHIVTGHDDHRLPRDVFSTHRMTGVDKLHAEGLLGQGLNIGIIDTGTDYTHPALGGAFGPGHKVAGGWDFVGDNYNGSNTPVPDADPLDQCAGHGTHVAGIVGADLDPVYNVTGVAPKATINSYRVFGCKGSVGDDVLVQALIRAYNDGNDVITLSIGGASGWTESVTAVVSSRVAQAGRIVTIAAGNDGQYGSWYSSSPGTAINAFSVASVDNIQTLEQTIELSNGHANIAYASFKPLNVTGQHPIYVTSNDTSITDDACNPLPDSTPDLSNYVVLIKRGNCTFTQKLDNAAAKGMKVALFYDNVPGVNSGIEVGNYTAAIMTEDDGRYLVGEISAGRPVSVSFPQIGGLTTLDSPTGGLMSSFSTYGPVNDLYFKPSIAAPGGNILSTYPVPLGSYAVLSGTSMATPFIAGSAALFLQAHNRQIEYYQSARSIFETTAVAVPSSKDDSKLGQTLAQSGAGLLNAYNAVHYRTVIGPAELLLNDTTHANLRHEITVTNNHATMQEYNVTHVPAGTAITMNGTFPIDYPVPLVNTVASMTSGAKILRIYPGETKKFTVKFTPPSGLDASAFPVYSGNVVIASETETLSVSYLGVAASMKDMTVLDTSSVYFDQPLPFVLNGNGNASLDATVYSFDGKDYPTLVYRLLAGTPEIKIDLLATNTSQIVGNIGEYDYQSRNTDGTFTDNGYDTLAWNPPTYANNTLVADGVYNFKISALRITGDPNNEKDWDTWVSPSFIVKKAANVTVTPTGTASAIASGTPTVTSSVLSNTAVLTTLASASTALPTTAAP